MECEWQSCRIVFSDYVQFQKHIKDHVKDLHVIKIEGGTCKKINSELLTGFMFM